MNIDFIRIYFDTSMILTYPTLVANFIELLVEAICGNINKLLSL